MKQIKCKECGKEYDGKLDMCPSCGYINQKQRVLKVILYAIAICLLIISVKSLLRHIYITNFLSDLNEFVIDTVDEQFANNINKATEGYQLGDYVEKYGSKTYGELAYTFDNIRIWSMSFCILLAFGGIYLKKKNAKIGNIIKYIGIALFIIFQLLPLGFNIWLKLVIY